jgi:predicted MPP superfamily phosphohydrolase
MATFKLKMFLGVLVFVVLVDIYVWQAIKTMLRNRPEWYKKIIWGVYWLVPVFFLLVFAINSIHPFLESYRIAKTWYMAMFFIIYVSKFFTAIFVLLDDIKRLLNLCWHWLERNFFAMNKEADAEEMEEAIETETKKITRSQFIARAGLAAGAVPFIFLTRGISTGAYKYQVRHVNLVIPKLPEAFDGIKMLQISDVHCGSFYDKDAVYRGIRMIKEQKAHIVTFTGDFVNNRTNESDDWADMFSEIKAPMGVFSILGNHDYGDYVMDWNSPEEKQKNLTDLYAVHQNMGWNLLRNEHFIIERENQRLAMIGVENWGDRGRFQKFGDIDAAKKGMPDSPVKILLSHDPSHFDTIISQKHPDIDLTLSGHTHGFQFGVELGNYRWSPSQYIYKHWADLYHIEKQMLYVNRGFGFLGYPGRVGILPEITVFTLNRTA